MIPTAPKLPIGLFMLGMTCTILAQEIPFLDPMFDIMDIENGAGGLQLKASSPNNNIPFGVGPTNGSSPGEMNLTLDLYHPTGEGLPDQLPGVVFIHGGGFWSGTKEDSAIRTLAIEYAKRGYIAASIAYRLNGVDPDEGNPSAAVNDATKALQWLVSQAIPGGVTGKLMTDKIVIGGGSAGAITALMQGCSNVQGAKPKVILNFWGGLLGNDAYYIDASDPPIFAVHGTSDVDVPFSNATNLCARLDHPQIQIPYQLFTLACQPHSPWNTVFNTQVEGKTILQHGVDFTYGHLALGPASSIDEITGPPGQMRIRYLSNKLVLHWRGLPGKSYDLLSDSQLSTPISSWPLYSEIVSGGSTLSYGNIPSGGNSIVVMTPYSTPAEAVRFFSVREIGN